MVKFNKCIKCGKKLKENHKCWFKCPICNSVKTRWSEEIKKCLRCGYINKNE
jgi:hypothetical protein